jgi:hypothetical protein
MDDPRAWGAPRLKANAGPAGCSRKWLRFRGWPRGGGRLGLRYLRNVRNLQPEQIAAALGLRLDVDFRPLKPVSRAAEGG